MIQFAYRLALAIGVANVEEPGGLLDQIGAWQLSRWMEFFRIEPWGSEVDALRFGGVAAMTYNCAQFSKGGKSAADFAIGLPARKANPQALADKIRAWAAAHAPKPEPQG